MPVRPAPSEETRSSFADRLAARDPDGVSTKRGVRAAVVVPVAFALARTVGNSQSGLFAAFAAFALMSMVLFDGPVALRARAYGLLLVVGLAFTVVGTLCSGHIAAAVPVALVLAFGVLFVGVASPRASEATTVALLFFVLPVAVAAPPSAIPARLGGMVLAAALAVPAVLFVWPYPYRARLRHDIAETAGALAAELARQGDARGDTGEAAAAQSAVVELRRAFEQTQYLPTGAAPGDDALCRLIGRLEWTESQSARSQATRARELALPDVRVVNHGSARVLAAAGAVIEHSRFARHPDPVQVAELDAAMADLAAHRDRAIAAAIERICGPGGDSLAARPPRGAPDPIGSLVDAIDPTFWSRAVAIAASAVGDDAVLVGWAAEGEGVRDRFGAFFGVFVDRLRAHAHLNSVWFRNSVRGAVGIALAVGVALATDRPHSFWVALGTLSVLRSNAMGTGVTALRAMVGVVIGVVVGSALLTAIGGHVFALWALLPVTVFTATVATGFSGFAAGQAAFTLFVMILFNIIQPVGWRVGLVRIEDVGIGCLVAGVVALLFWPRGATRALGRALCECYAAAARYADRALERIMSPRYDVDTEAEHAACVAASRRVDDAFRQYLVERGARRVSVGELTTLVTGAVTVRMAAEALATLPAQPLPDDASDLPAVVDAGASLRLACAATERWYVDMGAVLAGQQPAVPPVPDETDTLRAQVRAALAQARDSERPDRIRAVLRLMWTVEDLEDQHQLEVRLCGVAGRFTAGNHNRMLS